MRNFFFASALFVGFTTVAQSAPVDDTCRLAEILGGNRSGDVSGFFDQAPTLWSDDVLSSAIGQIETLAAGGSFDGASVWKTADFGNDLQEYLIVLRLRSGESSFARVRYEYTSNGPALVSLEIKRTYPEAMAIPFAQAPEKVSCAN